MTGTSVSSIGNLMNRAANKGNSANSRLDSLTNSFGAVMNQASSGRKDTGVLTLAGNQTKKVVTADLSKTKPAVNTNQTNQKEDVSVSQTESVHQTPAKEITDSKKDAVKEAGDQLVKKVAEEFDISEEDVKAAMEALGLSTASLLDAQSMTDLALFLSDSRDSLTLLTDEGLYSTVQDLLQTVALMKDDLMDTQGISPEELQQMLDQAASGTQDGITDSKQELSDGMGNAAQSNAAGQGAADGANAYSISISENGKTVELKVQTDEKGNTEAVKSLGTSEDAQEETVSAGQSGSDQNEAGKKGTGENNGNTLFNTFLQGNTQNAEKVMEATASFQPADTQEIMNQILDYMKIQLKPGMDQIEMQLHPASLGTIHIQIASKEGVITAQFTAQNEAVKAAIEGQLVELKENLKEQGIKVDAVEVAVESHSFESNLWQGKGQDQEAYEDRKKGPRRINLNDLTMEEAEEMDAEEKLASDMLAASGNTVDYTS